MRLEVVLDDVIVRAVNVIIIHTCVCLPSGRGWRAGGGGTNVIILHTCSCSPSGMGRTAGGRTG